LHAYSQTEFTLSFVITSDEKWKPMKIHFIYLIYFILYEAEIDRVPSIDVKEDICIQNSGEKTQERKHKQDIAS
jgi:hypothetical protein